jgi:hypothetical protein
MQIITSNGTKAEMRDGYLYFVGQETGIGIECSIEELEDFIEELAELPEFN